MGTIRARRSFLALLAALISAGCLGNAGSTTSNGGERQSDAPETTTPTPNGIGSETSQKNDTMTPTDNDPTDERTPVPPAKREELVAQLPDVSPLTGTLRALVVASDRAAVAEERGLELRDRDHSVRVAIELEPNGTFPDGYRVDVIDTYQDHVTAFVHVDDLVPLAIEDDVRKIQRPAESRPNGGSSSATGP